MAMEPLQSQWVNPPPTIAAVQSVYSPSGQQYTALNQFNNTPIAAANQQYLYGNQSYNMTPTSSDGGNILGNISDLSSVGKFVGNNFQLPQSSFLNSAGTSIGLAPGTVSYTGIGPGSLPWTQPGLLANQAAAGQAGVGATAGSLGSTATASGVLGAAGIGALAGGFLGRIGGNATGGSIGGGVGAGIGMAVGGPVGAAVGGLIGGIGGGFFGGKKPGTNSSEFSVRVNETGALEAPQFSAKNAKGYDNYNQIISQEFSDYMAKAKEYLGIDKFHSTIVRGGVNTLHNQGSPGFVMVGDRNVEYENWFGFDPADPAARQKALGQAVADLAKRSGATPEQIKGLATKLQESTNQNSKVGLSGMAFVPIKDNKTFANYVKNYKSQ